MLKNYLTKCNINNYPNIQTFFYYLLNYSFYLNFNLLIININKIKNSEFKKLYLRLYINIYVVAQKHKYIIIIILLTI